MPRTTTITLDATDYTIRSFNIGELERIQQLGGKAWEVLGIAMERAEPKVEDFRLLEPTPGELEAAFKKIMDLAGLKPPNPPAGAAPPPA